MRNQHERFSFNNAIQAYCISAPGATKRLMVSSILCDVPLAHLRWMNSPPPEQGIPL